MNYLVIDGVPGYDGRYEFDLPDRPFSLREWGWVKKHSGYLPLTVEQGFAGSDAELMGVFALIALVRAGKIHRDEVPHVWERFSDAPGVLTVRLEFAAEEEDADPPASSSSNGATSGDASPTSSGRSDTTPPATGTPASATSGFPQTT